MDTYMTETLIKESPWNAVDLEIPKDASPELLVAAEKAARECHYEAWGEVRQVDYEDADSCGAAQEFRWRADQAEERYREIGKLQAGRQQQQEQRQQR